MRGSDGSPVEVEEGDAGATSDDVAPDDVIEAVGKASEALEYVERARGHLYSFHQLMGHADLLFGDAADLLREAGQVTEADRIEESVVGRNVLDGRWTFQVVDEFDHLYHEPVSGSVRQIEQRLQGGRRHVFESRMKDDRRTRDRAGHERRPAATHHPTPHADD